MDSHNLEKGWSRWQRKARKSVPKDTGRSQLRPLPPFANKCQGRYLCIVDFPRAWPHLDTAGLWVNSRGRQGHLCSTHSGNLTSAWQNVLGQADPEKLYSSSKTSKSELPEVDFLPPPLSPHCYLSFPPRGQSSCSGCVAQCIINNRRAEPL